MGKLPKTSVLWERITQVFPALTNTYVTMYQQKILLAGGPLFAILTALVVITLYILSAHS